MSEHELGTEPTRETSRDSGTTQHAPAAAGTGATALTAGKANLTKRFLAMLIDAVLAAIVGFIPMIGGLLAGAYWLVRDGLDFELMDGRSIGKKIMKLRPQRLDGRPMDLETSVKRNWMFALGGLISLLLFIPIIGWLLIIPVALVALGIGIYEVIKVLTDGQGRRLGDTMARTKVIEVAD